MTDTSTTYMISSETRDHLTDLLEAVANGGVGYGLIKSAAQILPHIKGAPATDIEAAMDNILADVGLPYVPPTDPLFPNGRPECRNRDGRPVYMAGLCGTCWSAQGDDAPAGAGHSVEADRG